MKFTFTVHVAKVTKLMKIEVTIADEKVGTLQLQEDEWNLLRPVLMHGKDYFMDNEVEVEIRDARSSMPAFTEGVDG